MIYFLILISFQFYLKEYVLLKKGGDFLINILEYSYQIDFCLNLFFVLNLAKQISITICKKKTKINQAIVDKSQILKTKGNLFYFS